MKHTSCTSTLALSIAAWLYLAPISSAATIQPIPAPLVDAGATAQVDALGSQVELAAVASGYRDGSFVGPIYDAYFGAVQVRANVQGGRLVSVDVLQYPKHQRTSRAINNQALPMLESQVIRAQGTRVNLVSGATLTSKAYLRSLKGALGKASG